jgi:tRNA pseudouridine55 synthase
MHGSVALLRKPSGVSSFSALYPLKRSLETRKIGHTGTLDPFAEGLLVVLCGYATRLASFFSGLDKRYDAEFRFGVSTDTLDPEGVTMETADIPSRVSIERAICDNTGQISQIPPRFSAIKVAGKRSYAEARKGVDFELAPRSIEVFSIALLGYTPPTTTLSVHCSKGTYIRSLARDIGKACESAAYVARLNRTDVGPFRLDEVPGHDAWTHIRPTEALRRLGTVKQISTTGSTALRMRQGKPIDASYFDPMPTEDGHYAVSSAKDDLVGIIESVAGSLRYVMIVPN